MYIVASGHAKVWVYSSQRYGIWQPWKVGILMMETPVPAPAVTLHILNIFLILFSTFTLQILHKPASGTGAGIQVSLPLSECSYHKAVVSYSLLLPFYHRYFLFIYTKWNRFIIKVCKINKIFHGQEFKALLENERNLLPSAPYFVTGDFGELFHVLTTCLWDRVSQEIQVEELCLRILPGMN